MKYFVMLALVMCLTTSVEAESLPDGWILAGTHPKDYKVSLDSGVTYSGSVSAILESRSERAKGFGTLMQQCAPGLYLEKRVRNTGYIRCKDIKNWDRLWFRVFGENGKTLAFDNMNGRPIKGSTDWKQYQIVLDVPEGAKVLTFGVQLNGAGKVWIDDIGFEVVDRSIATTGKSSRKSYTLPSAPTNLDFEK